MKNKKKLLLGLGGVPPSPIAVVISCGKQEPEIIKMKPTLRAGKTKEQVEELPLFRKLNSGKFEFIENKEKNDS